MLAEGQSIEMPLWVSALGLAVSTLFAEHRDCHNFLQIFLNDSYFLMCCKAASSRDCVQWPESSGLGGWGSSWQTLELGFLADVSILDHDTQLHGTPVRGLMPDNQWSRWFDTGGRVGEKKQRKMMSDTYNLTVRWRRVFLYLLCAPIFGEFGDKGMFR